MPKRRAGIKKVAHVRSREQEKETAKRVGGKTTAASGALHEKGDVRVKRVARIECKTTTKDSYALKKEVMKKIMVEGMGAGELPFMEIEFIDAKGRPDVKVAVVPSWVMDQLIAEANNHNNHNK